MQAMGGEELLSAEAGSAPRALMRRQRILAAQLAVTSVLVERADATRDTRDEIIMRLTSALGWDVGLLWLADEQGRLAPESLWQADPAATEPFAEASRRAGFTWDGGMPGRVARTRQAVWLPEIEREPSFRLADSARAAGLRTAVVLPLLSAGRAFGALELLSRTPEPLDEDLRDMLTTVASQISEYLGRLEVQARLAEAQERFAMAFENAPIGMALVAPDGRWLQVNPALAAITGYSAEALRGMTFQDITHPEDLEADLAQVERMLAGEIATYDIEKRYRRADGSYVWVLLSVSMVGPRGEHPGYFIAQVQDITEAKAALALREQQARELARSNTELDQVAQVVAHDLREPLLTIAGFARLLESRRADALGAEAQEWLGHILDSADRARRLLDDILRVARAGSEPVVLATVDTAALVAETVADLHAPAAEAGAHIEIGDLPVVRADATQLGQVFRNLLSNAIRYRGERPVRITVRGERRGDEWCFSVSDNGRGIDPGEHTTIFQMFRQGAGARPGTGLGLALASRAVDRHGGRIWVESVPGSGSTFFFTLPAEPPDQDTPASPS